MNNEFKQFREENNNNNNNNNNTKHSGMVLRSKGMLLSHFKRSRDAIPPHPTPHQALCVCVCVYVYIYIYI
jgi:hypothetical protein